MRGERQIVFVTGEPGIGKTTLVEAFLHRIADPELWVGRGQCIEQYGTGEAYMPILEALSRLCREPGGERLIALLHQHAPTWLVQMPTLLNATDFETLQRKVAGATWERMLREMADAVDVLTAERPLVLWLEDLHWSDVSTLDLLALLARRREWARVLVIGTYRPVDVIIREHPLRAVKQELQLHGQCEELALRLLREDHIAEYLAARFGVPSPANKDAPDQPRRRGQSEGLSPATLSRLAHVIHERTEGNPLFMVNVVENLVTQGALVQSDGQCVLLGAAEQAAVSMPHNLRQLIEQHLDRLSPEERRVLEIASVAGVEFSAAAVAAGVEAVADKVEEYCARLARHEHFLRAKGTEEWPDGTIATRYSFLHALYKDVVYEQVSAGRRARLHQLIGEREEQAYGERAGEIAAALAVHFERSRDYRRAAQYFGQAGERAGRRYAYREAITHLAKGLELLTALPDTPERAQQELTLQIALGASLQATQGYAAPEVERAYARARALCQQVAETPQLFWVLRGLCVVSLLQAGLQTASELGQQLLTLAQKVQDHALLVEAHSVLGGVLFFQGALAPARAYSEQGLALSALQRSDPSAALSGQDPEVFCRIVVALALWVLGYADQALERMHEALFFSQELAHSTSHAEALFFAAWLHQLRREGQAARSQAEAVSALARDQGFLFLGAWGTILGGYTLAEHGHGQEGMEQIRQGLSAFRTTGAKLHRPYHLYLLAAAQGKVGQAEEGLLLLAEALATVRGTGERWYEAELYRLKGELTLQQRKVERQKSKVENHKATRTGQKAKIPSAQHLTPSTRAEAEAEACFLKAIDIARQQQAKSWELRATMSLARLWQQQGKKKEARQMLAEVFSWFTEGFDTADLKEAKALLEGLA